MKGIIAIKAMSKISELINRPREASQYGAIADDWVKQWMSRAYYATSEWPYWTQSTLSYGDTNSHSLLYNMYTDLELGLNLVPPNVYEIQDINYRKKLSAGGYTKNYSPARYGLNLDSRSNRTKGGSVPNGHHS
jgi:hypothetical protein